jgi:hypothetical protein
MNANLLLTIYLFAGMVLIGAGLLLTGFYYFNPHIELPSVFAWVSPLMIPIGFGMIVVGEREAR